jgi:hypothetical protein
MFFILIHIARRRHSSCFGSFSFSSIHHSFQQTEPEHLANQSEFSTHATNANRLEMNIIVFRRFKASCSDNQFNLLICVNETEVFALLLSKSNWPANTTGLSFDLTPNDAINTISTIITH